MTEAELAELMCALRAEVALAECRALSGDSRIFASELLDDVCDTYLELFPRVAAELEGLRTAHRMLIYRLLSLRGHGPSEAVACTRAVFDARFLPLLRGLMDHNARWRRALRGPRRTL